jgi:hypothetical protein
MDNRKKSLPEEQLTFRTELNSSQSAKVTEILQTNGYENLEAFLNKNPYQKHLMQEEGDLAFYHPNRLAEKLTLFFVPAKKSPEKPDSPIFQKPASPAK